MASLHPLPIFIIIFNLTFFFIHGWAKDKVIYEDGYTVTTVFDGDKHKINPHSISPRPGFNHLLLLDSSNSRFYTLSLPLSQESVKEFAGNGEAGFSDGDASTAKFDKPRSFAVDLKGNVYVADKRNFAIRKISKAGIVTTIAGSCPKMPCGRDEPGRNATFSPDYELAFVPDMCALLMSDHMHRLIRQIDLKPEDCVRSGSGVGANAVWSWVAAVIVSCLAGLVIGFTIRPYIMPFEQSKFLNISKSWTSYRTNLGRQTRMRCFGIRSAVASPALDFARTLVDSVLSHLYLLSAFVFKRVDSRTNSVHMKDYVSLLDSDTSGGSYHVTSQKYHEQLKDLMSFPGNPGASEVCSNILKEETEDGDRHGQIDDLVLANITKFAEDACKSRAIEQAAFLGVSTVVKRR